MNRMKIISKRNTRVSLMLPRVITNWIVFLAVVFCLTTVPAWSVDAPDTENKDAEVVKEADKTSEDTEEITEDISTKITDKSGSDGDEESEKMGDDVPVKVTKEIIEGTSDEMERDDKKGITILIGNAKTVRKTEEGVEVGFLNADKITLMADPETGETREIIAVGNVEIRDREIFATCDHATMNNQTNIIILKENVIVLQKEDRLETKLFTFNRVTGKQTGVGGVKFKVAVTQTTPVNPPEDSEVTDSDNNDTTTPSDDAEDKNTTPDTEKETNSNSVKPESGEKTTPKETEINKKKSESEEENETEPAESEETESTESEETEVGESEETENEESPEEEK